MILTICQGYWCEPVHVCVYVCACVCACMHVCVCDRMYGWGRNADYISMQFNQQWIPAILEQVRTVVQRHWHLRSILNTWYMHNCVSFPASNGLPY